MTATNIFYNFVGFRLVLGIAPPFKEMYFCHFPQKCFNTPEKLNLAVCGSFL